MPKMKRSTTAKKRFRWVSSGTAIKRAKTNKRHILTKKTSKRKRQLRATAYVSVEMKRHIERMLPY